MAGFKGYGIHANVNKWYEDKWGAKGEKLYCTEEEKEEVAKVSVTGAAGAILGAVLSARYLPRREEFLWATALGFISCAGIGYLLGLLCGKGIQSIGYLLGLLFEKA